jgi:hypothetical protein
MNAKKIDIEVLFLGGGYLFIKKILPLVEKRISSFNSDEVEEYEVKQFIDNRGGGRTDNPNQLGGNQSATNILSMEGSVITNRGGNYNTPRTGKQNSMHNAPL